MNAPDDKRPSGTDLYLSVQAGAEFEIKVKGSRFLAEVLRANSEAMARTQLTTIRRRYHDATHHCSAWRCGPPDEVVERFDDDGEPAGTAGRPLLSALQRAKLCDTMVVVTRYFGGTKLGSGGLARAYADAASGAVARSAVRTVYRCTTLRVHCRYEDTGIVETLLSKRSQLLRTVEREFHDDAVFRLDVLASHADRIGAEIVEATAGRAEIRRA